jgi:hypothetical protein
MKDEILIDLSKAVINYANIGPHNPLSAIYLAQMIVLAQSALAIKGEDFDLNKGETCSSASPFSQ